MLVLLLLLRPQPSLSPPSLSPHLQSLSILQDLVQSHFFLETSPETPSQFLPGTLTALNPELVGDANHFLLWVLHRCLTSLPW